MRLPASGRHYLSEGVRTNGPHPLPFDQSPSVSSGWAFQ